MSESIFLERHEEDVLFRYYERRMLDFCNAFKPAMPKSVVVCVFHLYNIIHKYGIFADICLTRSGYSNYVLQKILPEQLNHGVPPQDYHVRRFTQNSDVRTTVTATSTSKYA